MDIAFALAPSEKQLAAITAVGKTYEVTPLGCDAFVFYVSIKNPVSNITLDDIHGIYSGRITDWQEIGASEHATIIPLQRNKNSGLQTMLKRIMGDTPIMSPLKKDRLGDVGDIIYNPALDQYFKETIRFSFRYYAKEMLHSDNIKLLSIDGVAPTRENIANGTYPFIATAYIITIKERTDNVKKFIDFMLSPHGREIVEKTGYVFHTE